jgi:DNA-binding CsgD family transcriptional regulator
VGGIQASGSSALSGSQGSEKAAYFRVRTAQLLARTAAALPAPAVAGDPAEGGRALADRGASAAALRLAAESVLEALRARGHRKRSELLALTELLCELHELERELSDRAMRERLDAVSAIPAGLARLRAIGSSAEMLRRASQEVCQTCGFDRAVISRICGDRMLTESVFCAGDPAGAALLLQFGRRWPRPLLEMPVETQMIRRRMPIVVDPDTAGRIVKWIVEGSGTRSYVAAPIMPSGRVIGFVHADCHYRGHRADGLDRDLLWAFTEGFGHLYERSVLLERLRAQRDSVRSMVASTERIADEICAAAVELERSDREDTASTARAAAMISHARVDEVLTVREREIISLMASGETNARIATRLVIAEGTVKSHVKHILRKLHASNRAEAVSRYLLQHAQQTDGEHAGATGRRAQR